MAEIRDIADGLWVWSRVHPEWTPGSDFDGPVTSTCVAADGEVVLLDPLAPEPDDAAAWARLDAAPPTVVVVLKPDHVRDVDLFVGRYGARAFGLELPFERVIVSHGDPVHDRAAFERALSSELWRG